MQRFFVRPAEGDEYCELVDRTTGKVVFHDRMEPEDATLYRDLRHLVDLLNKVAGPLETPKSRCSFCKSSSFLSANFNMGEGKIWNVCGSQSCKDQMNEIVKKQQEEFRKEQASSKKNS